ncbi:WXG100 family type VII secretion target [Paenibacillus amylolyticus]|uniref:WXG100 family type VII secretion target n=1 Tax=Paenibacillus amylolyticus TaxID=1451 RepID=A0A5M9WLI5_PAEAM|nr:WXG100 family type VII secretion target [Paenibacillus amylolyticus]KAA8782368.1 WXG100 family type VII secretion target [Paenibacillus amylolyticus]
MSTIKVTPEQLHHVSNQVDQARQQLEHIQDNLSRQIMFLQAMWMGVTQERFYDDFARSRPVLQKALESMVYTTKELKDIAIRFENADAEKGSLGSVIGAVGAAAMMKSSASDAGSGNKGYRMKKVDVYGRYVWVPVNENGELDYTAVQAYAKDQGNVNIDRMQGVHVEAPEEDIFKMQVKSLENRIHPFTGEPVSDKYAQMMLTSLKFSQIFMAFQMVRGSMPGRKGPFRLPASDPAVAKIKKNLEAAEAGKTRSTERTINVRTFISTDKYVGETANAIEARYPGKVVDVNKKVYRADGTPLTDYDIELDNAIIQVKQGGGKGATRQAINTASSTNKEVIVYLPNQISNSAVVKGLQKEGFQVFTSETDLINYVGR